jgi:hypothetical protein
MPWAVGSTMRRSSPFRWYCLRTSAGRVRGPSLVDFDGLWHSGHDC